MSPTKESTTESSKNKRPIDGQNTSSNQTADAIAAELSGSDLGQLINEYKNVVIAILVLFAISAVSYVSWKSIKNSQHESSRAELLKFKNEILKPAQEKKKSLTEMLSAYQQLVTKANSGAILMEITPEIMFLLKGQAETSTGDWSAAFEASQKLCSKNDYCYLHFGLVLANYFEEIGKFDQALEKSIALIGNPFVVEDKLYFDLVRLAHNANKLEQKKQYLDHLKKNHLTSNYKILAEQL